MIPNVYQQNIFEFVKSQVDKMNKKEKPINLVCTAGAGCGKTATIVNCLDLIPRNFNVAFFAFNRDIVESLRNKVPSSVRVQTFHAAGFGALRYRYKNIHLDDKKMVDIFQNLMDTKYRNITSEESGMLISPFLKLVGLVKNTMFEPTNANLIELSDKYNIDIEDSDETLLFDIVREGIRISNSNVHNIDFNDMIFLPVTLGLSFYKIDIAFVDETQDLNPSQLLILRRIIKDDGFIVCVGDKNQSIYGFRGADISAIDKMIRELDATVLPLMVTYRCGKNIVKLANELVPELEAFSGNIDGEVKDVTCDVFYEMIKEGDMVLCRNNAPLIKPVFHLLGKGIKVTIKGRDIGEGLIRLVKKLKAYTIEEFYATLDKWKSKEESKALRKKSDSMMQSIEDKYQCLIAISEDCNNVNEIVNKISRIFDDGRSAITFSSVHRAKGLEADRVFLLEPQLIPSKWAKKDWEIVQERNILYVAITRAKSGLYMVGGKINTKF